MKFYCDQCSAKYSIPDEKVRGKVVKVRCKECDHVITVRGSQRKKTGTDDGSRGTGASAGRDGHQSPSVQWYYSHQGETYGPHDESDLRDQYRRGEIPRASYVWRDGFSDWKPAEDVEPFAAAIEQASGPSEQPDRKKTQGVGGDALEAIEPADEQLDQEPAGDAQAGGEETSDQAPSARTSGDAESSTRSTDKGTGRAERLERLRNRLQTSFAEDESESHEPTVDEPIEGGDVTPDVTDADGGSVDETTETSRSALDDIDVEAALGEDASESDEQAADQAAQAPTTDDRTTTEEGLGTPEVSGDRESADDPSADLDVQSAEAPEQEDDDFDLPPAGSDRLSGSAADEAGDPEGTGPTGTPESDEATGVDVESHDGLFDEIDEQGEPEVAGAMADATGPQRDTGGDTDIPTTPKLGDDDESSKSLRDSVSESLLIQIDNIKKTDRSQYYKWGGVAVLFVALIGGVWMYLYNPEAANDLFGGAEREESRTAIAGNEGGLEFQTYSDENVVNFGATEVPKNPQETGGESSGSTGSAGTGGGTAGAENTGASGSSESETLTGGTESLFAEDDEDLEKALAKSNRQTAKAGGGESGGSTSKSGSSGQGAVAAQASAGGSESGDDSDPFAGLDEIDSPTAGSSSAGGPNIEAPEDNLGKEEEASSLSSQLSKERISRAIRNVSKSVGTCRQRHARHGASLDAQKVTIVFTVERDGRVSAFQLNPKSVRNSRFEKCLQARKGRWNFGPIPNAPQQMKAPFILQ